jgi:hypothetical protein
MDGHGHPPCPFHQLEGADIAFAEPVFLHKHGEGVVPDALGAASITVLDAPLVFPIRPDKCDLVQFTVKVISNKSAGEDLSENISCVSGCFQIQGKDLQNSHSYGVVSDVMVNCMHMHQNRLTRKLLLRRTWLICRTVTNAGLSGRIEAKLIIFSFSSSLSRLATLE